MDEMRTNVSIEPEYDIKPELSVSRFVKVFMQGEVVGRKINVGTHSSYASLSFTLKRLANNFSMPSCELNDMVHNEDGGALDGNDFIFYDTQDGDRFFLGEVSWELFVISVRRIYIVRVQENGYNNDLLLAENEDDKGESPYDANVDAAAQNAPLYGVDDAPGNDDYGDASAGDGDGDAADVPSAGDGAGEE